MGYISALGDLGLRAEGGETRYAYPLTGGGRLVEYASGAVLRCFTSPGSSRSGSHPRPFGLNSICPNGRGWLFLR
jgi:hypothetical protein